MNLNEELNQTNPSKIKNHRNSNILEYGSMDKLLKQFIRLSLQNPDTPNNNKNKSTKKDGPPDLKTKYFEEYIFEQKSFTSMSSKKPKKSNKSTDFDCRFLFYDKLLPIFMEFELSNKCFFRMIFLIEKALSYQNFDMLEHYRKIKQTNQMANIEQVWFNYWFKEIAMPCLIISVEHEMPDSKILVSRLLNFSQTRYDLYDFKITNDELLEKKLTVFIWNDFQVDLPTHYDAMNKMLNEKDEYRYDLSLIRDVLEKVLIVNLCYDWQLLELSMPTICNAVIYHCLWNLDLTFKKYLSDSANLTQSEKNKVKGLYLSLKKLRINNKTIEGVLKSVRENFEVLQDEEMSLFFKSWKFVVSGEDDECSIGRSDEEN